MGPDEDWVSASDLADYAYCPRSYWYRYHPPPGSPSSNSQRSAAGGVRYHDRVLTAERHRDERGAAYWGILLLGVAIVAGGVWWVLRP